MYAKEISKELQLNEGGIGKKDVWCPGIGEEKGFQVVKPWDVK